MTHKIDVDKFEHWLNRRWKSSVKCPVCTGYDWNYGDRLFELRKIHDEKTIQREIDIYPLVTVTCNLCGYTRFFNAIVVGLTTPK